MGAFTKPIQLLASAKDDPPTLAATTRGSNPLSQQCPGPGKNKTWNGENAKSLQNDAD